MDETTVRFEQVGYRIGGDAQGSGRELIRDVSLELEAGSVTALLGRSGSGKTTLLRMINGLVMPSSGSVHVKGRATADWPLLDLRRSIGYVIQESGLFPHMTVARNVALPLELAGKAEPERDVRAAAMLALVGLDDSYANRYPWQLSGGQRQRVGVARALASEPGILLLDEPFGALDPITRAEMQTMLGDLLARMRKTVLLVTHDLDEALYLADRVIFLDAGAIVADMPSREVLSSGNEHVRAYVAAVHRAMPPAAQGEAEA